MMCFAFLSATASAQNALPVLPTGDAAVAGFSGTIVLGSPPPPEPKRIDKTYINLDGPSLRVIGLGRMGGPPQAQLVAAPKTFTATARQIGQVFSLALDDANPPNVYAAASSAYGLPIVVPDADGDGVPDRSRLGAPNAAFMPGLFGPVTVDGGPGSIWRIDGRTGAVTLFANVTLGGVPNSGPALGALAFDPVSHQIFVADRDTGLIHRFTLDGVERGRFDHGTQALPVAGLPPIGFDPRKRLNIESPAFDTGNSATWAYAPPARRVFGMAVNGGRLYYAVAAGLRIWSVSLLPDGSFGSDARGEVSVPRGALPNSEVSEILFDDNGDMLVAERGAPTSAYDYKALAESPENRVLRFRPKTPNDPPSRDLWFPVPKEYAIGFPPTLRNDDGGIAIGYGYDPAGNINRAVCGGTLWSTGEQLRNARDRATIQRLQAGGALIVDGLQGNSTRLLRPLNEPPFESYFIDYDDRFDDPQTRGYMGDVVIWRTCGQAMLLPVVPVVLICPPGLFDVDGACRFPLTCPAGTEFSDGCCGYRGCPASYVRINGKCVPPQTNCNAREILSEGGRCESPKCPAGMVFVSNDAGGGAAPAGLTAPGSLGNPGALNKLDQLDQKLRGKPKMCSGGGYCKCPEGTQRSEDGTCKKSNSCGPGMVDQGGECVCDSSSGWQGVVNDGHYSCVKIAQCDQSPEQCCPSDLRWNRQTHTCEPPAPRCDPSDPTTMVRKAGQCLCKDGSSPAGRGGIGGNNPIPGLPDGLLQPASSCCPSGRQLNPITNKCDPGNPGTPHLTIVKSAPDSCTPKSKDGQVSVFDCVFTITIANDGTAPANDVSVTDQPTNRGGLLGTIVSAESGGWNCGVGNNPTYNWLTTATCHKAEPLRPGESNTIQVTLEVTTDNYVPNPNPGPGPARGGGQPDSVFNCAAIGTVPAYGPVDLPAGTESCKSIVVPRNPKNPPVTTCTPTRKPPCSGNNGDGRIYCLPGECSCASGAVGPEGHQQQLCVPGECMTTCPTSGTPPIPPPPPPPPTITVTCPEGTRMGLNGQCYFVDPGCRGPNCPQPVLPTCIGSDCPTPNTTTTCTYPPNFMVNGQCCNARSLQDGSCGGTQTSCPFPKILSGGQCVCRGGTVGDDCHVPTTTTGCTGGKILSDNVCVCPTGKNENESGNCVRTGTSEKRVPRKPRKPVTKPDSDKPVPAGPQFNIQIGPGFPGGGHPGGGKPGGGMPKTGGGCGLRCG
jgi:hypothetical protein